MPRLYSDFKASLVNIVRLCLNFFYSTKQHNLIVSVSVMLYLNYARVRKTFLETSTREDELAQMASVRNVVLFSEKQVHSYSVYAINECMCN